MSIQGKYCLLKITLVYYCSENNKFVPYYYVSIRLFHLQDFVFLPETLFEEICIECDREPSHCDGQLSRQRKRKNSRAESVCLKEKFLKCIPWEFLPLNETHFYSLSSHHMSLPDLLGMSAQPKYDSGSSVLKQFFLRLQKLEIFQQDVTERQSAPPPSQDQLDAAALQPLHTNLGILQIGKWKTKFKYVCKDKSLWNFLCLRPSVCQYACPRESRSIYVEATLSKKYIKLIKKS